MSSNSYSYTIHPYQSYQSILSHLISLGTTLNVTQTPNASISSYTTQSNKNAAIRPSQDRKHRPNVLPTIPKAILHIPMDHPRHNKRDLRRAERRFREIVRTFTLLQQLDSQIQGYLGISRSTSNLGITLNLPGAV